MRNENVYHTNDPEKLLALKRLEADALLDVLRMINQSEMKIAQLCRVSQNLLRAQLGVKKMAFFYEQDGSWHEGFRVGFPALGEEAQLEGREATGITAIVAGQFPALHRIKAEYIISIANRNEAKAYFLLADFADSEVEAQNDLIFIETLGNILAVAIENQQLIRERVNQEFLRREMEVAETIQRQLLISDFDRFSGIDVFALNISHFSIGGDFYDVIEKDSGSIFVCIADVSGKGIGAALLMSNLQANLRALCARYNEVPVIVRELNRIFHSITVGDKFVTLFIARIDLREQVLTYVNAGHNYPLLIHSSGSHRRLQAGCVLLGIMPELEIEQACLSYHPGDVLFMFTDGVVEQANQQEEMFGSERIIAELSKIREVSAREMVEALRDKLTAFAGSSKLTDDMTLLAVKFQ
ncbi:MAG: hypothetical protein OHK0039_00360 [Bacteroidia bacterium]